MNKDQVIIRIIDPGESKAWISFKNYHPVEVFYVRNSETQENTHLMFTVEGREPVMIPLNAVSFMKTHSAASQAFDELYPQSPFFSPTRGFLITVHQSQQTLLEGLDFLQKYIPQNPF